MSLFLSPMQRRRFFFQLAPADINKKGIGQRNFVFSSMLPRARARPYAFSDASSFARAGHKKCVRILSRLMHAFFLFFFPRDFPRLVQVGKDFGVLTGQGIEIVPTELFCEGKKKKRKKVLGNTPMRERGPLTHSVVPCKF